MDIPHAPGAYFLRDYLLLLGLGGRATVIGAWPELDASRRRGVSWERFEPGFRLVRARTLSPQLEFSFAAAATVREPEALRRARAFDEFRSTMPKAVALHTERYRSGHWRMLRLFRERIEAVELAAQNPALAFCLAHHPRFCRNGLRTKSAELSRHRQRDILGALGFPQREGAARILAKIVPKAIHIRSMERLRVALREPARYKLLAHVPSIHAGVLNLVNDARVAAAVTPRLLAEVANSQDEAGDAPTARLLSDTLGMARELGRDLPPVFYSIRRLREVHDEVAREFARWHRVSSQFPPPPVPGTPDIVPLCTPRDLIQEGVEQGNCVASYIESVVEGELFIYRVLRPERATLSIVWTPCGIWEISELALRKNREPSLAVRHAVSEWLRPHFEWM